MKMNKYNETISKIEASPELKERIIAAASEAAASDSPAPEKARGHERRGANKRSVNWFRISAAAIAVLMAVSFGLAFFRPWETGGGTRPPLLPWTGGGGEPWVYDGVSHNVITPAAYSREDIVDLLKGFAADATGQDSYYLYGIKGDRGDTGVVAENGAQAPQGVPGKDGPNGNDYATTNVQQEGVDEGDIIKVDNNYIYTLSRAGLMIVSAGDKMKLCYEEYYENFYPDELFILDNKLIVIGGEYSQFAYPKGDIGVDCVPYWYYRTNTKVIIYDLKDRVNVELLKEYSISGNFITSRLIGNKLIVTVSHTVNYYNEDTYFPKINGGELPANNIRVYETETYSNYAIVASLNLNNLKLDVAAHLGLMASYYGSVVYFSKENVYFFVTMYKYKYEENSWSYTYTVYTVIVRINLNSLNYSGSQEIEGTVSDRYWADEYENNLRVVSHVWQSGGNARHTRVCVLNSNLEIIGTITNIAPGEGVYSVRFHGDEGSMVTYLQIDPLFKLDLSDPENPKISEGLKEPGVSDYLQYLSKDVILGLGRNLPSSGMKISLYDNTGADAVNIKTINIGSGYAYSEALYNPKAILNDTAKNMFSFAVTSRGGNYLSLEEQGLMVFEYDLKAKSLVYRGFLSNIQKKTYADWNDYNYDYYSYVKRGARIGDKIYTISDRFIASYDINTLKLIQRLSLEPHPCHITHRWGEWHNVSPTCTKGGSSVRYCKNNPLHVEKYTYEPYGHYFNEWTITKMPTATKPGEDTRTCYRYNCGHKETRQLVGVDGIDGLALALNEKGAGYTVRTYVGAAALVEIPAEVKGKPVTSIDYRAFENNKNIKSVTIPKSVTSIGYYAFMDSSVQSITFGKGSSLETLENCAFYCCPSLKTITLPKSVAALPHGSFWNCTALESVCFEDGSLLGSIGSYAFYSCQSLKNITIPQNVTSIGYSAFCGCISLESIVIPSKVTAIGYGTFNSCVSLKSVYIPASVRYIASDTFYYTPLLESLTVEAGNAVYKSDGDCLIAVSANALIAGCNSSVIPDYVTSIGNYAFYGSGIKDIKIPERVKYIGYYAFANCAGITSIDIPASVMRIDYGAFMGWTPAQTINVYGAEDAYASDVRLGTSWRGGCNAVIKYII